MQSKANNNNFFPFYPIKISHPRGQALFFFCIQFQFMLCDNYCAEKDIKSKRSWKLYWMKTNGEHSMWSLHNSRNGIQFQSEWNAENDNNFRSVSLSFLFFTQIWKISFRLVNVNMKLYRKRHMAFVCILDSEFQTQRLQKGTHILNKLKRNALECISFKFTLDNSRLIFAHTFECSP